MDHPRAAAAAGALGVPGRSRTRNPRSTADPGTLLPAVTTPAAAAERDAAADNATAAGARPLWAAAGTICAANLPGSDQRTSGPLICSTRCSWDPSRRATLPGSGATTVRRRAIGPGWWAAGQAEAAALQLQRTREPRENGPGQAGGGASIDRLDPAGDAAPRPRCAACRTTSRTRIRAGRHAQAG